MDDGVLPPTPSTKLLVQYLYPDLLPVFHKGIRCCNVQTRKLELGRMQAHARAATPSLVAVVALSVVRVIPHNGMTQQRHMDTQLVPPTGTRLQPHFGDGEGRIGSVGKVAVRHKGALGQGRFVIQRLVARWYARQVYRLCVLRNATEFW